MAAVDPVLARPGPPGVEAAVAAGRFEGAIRLLVHGLKFRRRLALAAIAARLMARGVSPVPAGVTALVPVPADPVRRLWRGFDPAEELALALAAELRLPVAHCLRRRPGPRQVGRPRADRLASPPVVRLRGRPPAGALLVDDVWTTGATLSASAAVLRRGGCERVLAAVLARTSHFSGAPRPDIPLVRGAGSS